MIPAKLFGAFLFYRGLVSDDMRLHMDLARRTCVYMCPYIYTYIPWLMWPGSSCSCVTKQGVYVMGCNGRQK